MIEFEVGNTYENEKGLYEVLSVDNGKGTMIIRWESGEKTTAKMDLQRRILERRLAEKEGTEISNCKTSKRNKRSSICGGFDLFKDQQRRFKEALIQYDPSIWFPTLRGNFESNNPGNWFICFVPGSWGKWKEASYGVHFDFIYARPCGNLPERFRLVIGVENPMQHDYRHTFKEKVISGARAKGIAFENFDLQAQDRKKLLESSPIPFNEQSWQISIQRYMALQPLVDVISLVVKNYYDKRAFDVHMDFPD